MGKPLIVLGNSTSHGGKVISASTQSDTGGKPIARVGDMVACPQCRGLFPIAQGDASLIIDGSPAAYDGCKTACGAALIAGQYPTTTNPSGGAAPGANTTVSQSLGSIGNGLAAAYEEHSLDNGNQRFKGRFQLLNDTTGEPVAQKDMRVRSTGGQYLTGSTDADGYTQWVERDAAEALAFDLTGKPS